MTAHSTVEAAPAFKIHWFWLVGWGIITTFAVFEVAKHGYIDGDTGDAIRLTSTAIGFFILPDLTFAIGASQKTPQGYLPTSAVPYYNSLHRMMPAFGLTALIGIGLAPLSTLTLTLFVGGLSWMAHIALDRAAGYGLRNPDGSR